MTSDSTEAPIYLKGFLDSIDTSDFWSYDGSFTTPPCTEGIKWNVLQDIQPINDEELSLFQGLWSN